MSASSAFCRHARLTHFAHTPRVAGVQRGRAAAVPRSYTEGGALGYTYRRRRSGPNWGLIVSLVLVAGAAAYFVPQYMNPQAGPPPPPLGGDAAPVAAAAPSPVRDPAAPRRLAEADQQMAAGHWSAAAAIYADVARAAPNLAAAQAGWARALVYANKPAEAIEHAQKAADLEPQVGRVPGAAGAGLRLVGQSGPRADQRAPRDRARPQAARRLGVPGRSRNRQVPPAGGERRARPGRRGRRRGQSRGPARAGLPGRDATPTTPARSTCTSARSRRRPSARTCT